MSPSKAEYFRASAEDCCRKAVLAEDIDHRSHWLEAAARRISLAREEGIWARGKASENPQRQTIHKYP